MATTIAQRTEEVISKCAAMVGDLLQLPTKNVWIDYDQEADVLYISFRKPQRATKTVELEEDILVRKQGSEIVGVTIINASAHRRRRSR